MTAPVIGFDARMVHHSGIGTHIRGMTHALVDARTGNNPAYNFTFIGDRAALQQYPWFSELGSVKQNKSRVYSLREQFFYPKVQCAFYHFPHYNVPQKLNAPYAVTVHDLIHLLFPEVLGSRVKWNIAKWLLQKAVARAERIFTVSHWTKKDLIEKLGVLPQKIILTPNAVRNDFRPVDRTQVEDLRERLGLPEDFVLAVGINKPHKNFPFLIKAFANWKARAGSNCGLVFCGVDSRAVRSLQDEATAANVDVRFLPFMTHEQMPALYQAASVLVFPSLYEGFGLPVLEAQRVGLPVIASSASCIPEVGGEGALYFDPKSPGDLTNCLDAVFGGDGMRERLIEKGYANEQRYSWRNSAAALLKGYDEFRA